MSGLSTPRDYKSWVHNDNVKIPYTTIRRYRKNIFNKFNQVKSPKSRKSLFKNDFQVNKLEANESSSNLNIEKNFPEQIETVNDNISFSVDKHQVICSEEKEIITRNLDKEVENLEEKKFDKKLSIKLGLLSIYIEFRPSKMCMNVFIKMMRHYIGNEVQPNFDSLIDSFKKEFYLKYDIYTFCLCCNILKENCNDINNNCPSCSKTFSKFFHLNIKSQLESILNCQKNRIDFSLNSENNIYKKISYFHSKFITLTINSDGISIFKSSRTTIWPVYLTINQIDKKERFKLKNVIIAGLWVSKEKPVFEEFLKPIVEELKILEKGIFFEGDMINIFLTNGVFDKPARAAILNTIQFNGKFGCIKCYQPGKNIPSSKNGTIHVYPFQHYHHDKPKRTHDKYLSDLRQAVLLKKPFRGIKGDSMLNQLSFYFPIESTVIDYMHSILEGVVRSLVKYLFFPEYTKRSCSLRKHFMMINKQLVDIKVPDFIPRSPRSLDDLGKWKANELFSFLIYYSLPLFRFIMEDNQLYHLINLVVGVEYLLTPNLDDEKLEIVNLLFKDFVKDMEYFYGADSMLSGVHELIHLTEDFKNNGHLSEFNCFTFEDLNRQITSFLKAKNLVGVQLINSFNVLKIYYSYIDKMPAQLIDQVFPWKNNLFKELTHGKILSQNHISEKILDCLKKKFNALSSNFQITNYVKYKNIIYTSINYKDVKSLNYCVKYEEKFAIIHYFCFSDDECVAVLQILSKLHNPFYNIKFSHNGIIWHFINKF
ncbi:unnamed protein product [Brachionus calyciflorus]|uniref:Transposase domain-containing protein n=1 Tax=Brachionus calyciflorus TaxID=104777 RepID=A0A814AW62_9BILA|nr:unnamed protein product [Brachionus calyciflorus]